MLSEFVLITYHFKRALLQKRFENLYIVVAAIVSALYFISTYAKHTKAKDDVQAYNYFDASFFYAVYIILALLGLYKVMKEARETSIERSPLFLSSVAFLLYASGVLLLFLFKDAATTTDKELYGMLWIYFFRPLNIIKNILLAFSLKNASRRLVI